MKLSYLFDNGFKRDMNIIVFDIFLLSDEDLSEIVDWYCIYVVCIFVEFFLVLDFLVDLLLKYIFYEYSEFMK